MEAESHAELEALRLLGRQASRGGRPTIAIGYYKEILRLLPNDFDTLVTLGDLCARAGDRKDQGISYYGQALEIKPQDVEVKRRRAALLQERVRMWHYRMMNDEIRNQAFEGAIRAAVKPGAVVLDIGAGSGLLAMMAARAGAEHVYTVELNGTIGDVARQIIANNGFSDQITVLSPFLSTDLRLGEEILERADVVTGEVLGNDPLAEGIVQAFADARLRLLKPGGQLIPCRSSAFAMMVESPEAYKMGHVEQVSGFEMSPFNSLLGGRVTADLIHHYPHRLLSEPFEVFTFDFAGAPITPEKRTFEVTPAHDGVCHLLVHWHRVVCDDTHHVDTWSPTNVSSCTAWLQQFQFCDPPLKVEAGVPVNFKADHDLDKIYLDVGPVSRVTGKGARRSPRSRK